MFNLFSVIIHKATTIIAGAMITIGLSSAPAPIAENAPELEAIEAPITMREQVIIQAPRSAEKKKSAPIAVASSTPSTTTKEPTKESLATENKSKPVDGAKYTVQKGDTLSGIAKKFGANKDEIIAVNHLNIETALTVGGEIIIPYGTMDTQEWCKKMVSLSTVKLSGGYMGTEYAEQYYATLPPPATTTMRSDVGVNGAGKRGYWQTNAAGINEFIDVDKINAEYNVRYNAYINDKTKVQDQFAAYSEARSKCPEDQQQRFASNAAIQAIDAFLSDPTINNLKTFCTNAKSLIGYDSERQFNADRTDFIYRPLTLYENLKDVCPQIIDQKRAAPYSWVEFKYSDSYLLPLTNSSESDAVRIRKIEYNNKIKSLAQYKLIGFNNQWGSNIIEAAQKTAESTRSYVRWGMLGASSFLSSFIVPESSIFNIKTKIQSQLIAGD